MGYALVCELVSRGVEVVAFSRGKEKLESLFKNLSNVTIFPGDAFNQSELMKAADGVKHYLKRKLYQKLAWFQHLKMKEQEKEEMVVQYVVVVDCDCAQLVMNDLEEQVIQYEVRDSYDVEYHDV